MTFVLNKCYGGFSLSAFAVEKLGVEDEYAFLDDLQMDAFVSLAQRNALAVTLIFRWQKFLTPVLIMKLMSMMVLKS